MSTAYLPQFLQGDGAEPVDKNTARAAKALAKGKDIDQTLKPAPSPDSGRSSLPVFLARTAGGEGFHVSGLLPQVYDAWLAGALKLDDQAFEQAIEAATAIYTDLLSRPWGVLCALTYDAFVWLKPGRSPTEDLDKARITLFLEGLQREATWLRSLDGRFSGILSEKPGQPWQVHNTLNFLAARNKLPVPMSWKTWDSAVADLLNIYK